jgi:hypothetical protein
VLEKVLRYFLEILISRKSETCTAAVSRESPAGATIFDLVDSETPRGSVYQE